MSEQNAYQQAGVDIKAGERAVELMKDAVADTYTPNVLDGIGGFGGDRERGRNGRCFPGEEGLYIYRSKGLETKRED